MWSLVETQRHLLFASDAWLGNAVLEEETPYHPWGFPAGGMPPDATVKLGLTLEATPTLDESARAAARPHSFLPVHPRLSLVPVQ